MATGPPRIGLFGLLGSGNIGNDGSLEAVLDHLRERHPEAHLELMSGGSSQVTDRYRLPATRMHWSGSEYRTASNAASIARKLFGKLVDAFRTVRWVLGLDVVIVPGMGVLEATVPLRPWAFPYSLFLLCAGARLVGTRTVLLGVGADHIEERVIRWLTVRSARLASYRSYRDEHSWEAMRRMGVDTSRDGVYPDLAFALPTPPTTRHSTGIVGVGVMDYRGRNSDRGRADEVHAGYLEAVNFLVRRLVDEGRRVRLFTGDRCDEAVVRAILADLRARRPEVESDRVLAEPATDLHDLMRQMAGVDTVVATRYHNVLCALKMSKPTVCLGYAAKHNALMDSMGLGEFCLSARAVNGERLLERFTALEARARELRSTLVERNRAVRSRLDDQFAELSNRLVPSERRDTG